MATLLDPGSCPGQALVQWLSPGPAGPPYRRLNNLGICRIALKARDIESVYQDLKAQGVEFMYDPTPIGQDRGDPRGDEVLLFL